LGARQRSLCAFQIGLKLRRIDLIERLARLHVTALGEQALQHHAAHLRAHLGDPIRGGAARQIGGDGYRLRMQRHHSDFRWCSLDCGFGGRARRQHRDADETEDRCAVEGRIAAIVHCAILYRFTAGNPSLDNDRIIASERLGGRSCFAVAAGDRGALPFSHRASSCLSRSMNQRPAGPGGLSVRYTADIAMTWPSGGADLPVI